MSDGKTEQSGDLACQHLPSLHSGGSPTSFCLFWPARFHPNVHRFIDLVLKVEELGRAVHRITENIPEYKYDFLPRNFLEIFNYDYKVSLLYFRELCLVRAHDNKLTKEAEKAHKDLAQALLDAEKNAK